MNQVLTGKFIADERKKKGFTQTDLADKLGISNRTVDSLMFHYYCHYVRNLIFR